MVFIYSFDDVSSNYDLTSDHSWLLGTWIVNCFSSNIYFVLVLLKSDSNVHEVSVSDRPITPELHVVNFDKSFFDFM